jgi:hypothetical protein
MKTVGLALLVAVLTSQQAYGWGAVAGPYGGAAYRGPIVQGHAIRRSGCQGTLWRRGGSRPNLQLWVSNWCCRGGRCSRSGCRSRRGRLASLLPPALLYALLSLTMGKRPDRNG